MTQLLKNKRATLRGERSTYAEIVQATASLHDETPVTSVSREYGFKDNLAWAEAKFILLLGWPLLLTYACHASTSLVAIYFVGRLTVTSTDSEEGGASELAAVALATTFANITGFSVAYGMASALDTLASQFAGSILGVGSTHEREQSTDLEMSPIIATHDVNETIAVEHQLGILLQRSLLIMALTSLPIVALWFSASPILNILAHQPLQVSTLAGQYTSILTIGIVPFFMYECIKRYLLALNHVYAPLFVMLTAAVLNIVGHLILCQDTTMGFHGSAIAMSIAYFSTPFIACAYMYKTKCHQRTWGGVTLHSLKMACTDWKPYLKLAIPGTLMICAEWWAFEICALLAGTMGVDQLASHSIVQTTVYALYMVPFGLSSAVCVRVGNLLGANDAMRARIATRVTLTIVAVSMLVNGIFLYLLRTQIGEYFAGSSNVKVIQMANQILPICALYQVLDGCQAVSSGILRGCGYQNYAASVTLFSYYCVGIPISIYLGFYAVNNEGSQGFGVVGLWWGIFGAVISISLGLVSKVLFGVNWQLEAKKASHST